LFACSSNAGNAVLIGAYNAHLFLYVRTLESSIRGVRTLYATDFDHKTVVIPSLKRPVVRRQDVCKMVDRTSDLEVASRTHALMSEGRAGIIMLRISTNTEEIIGNVKIR
jgi:hypothetical protein